MTTILRTVQRCLRKVFYAVTSLTGDGVSSEYEAWRRRFLWERLRIWFWIVLFSLLTFAARDIYNIFYPLKELAQVPTELRSYSLLVYTVMIVSVFTCMVIHRTKFGRRHPGLLFLFLSWSLTLTGQIIATISGFAAPNIIAWTLIFLSQAIVMPVRWQIHLGSQLVVLGYYFGVNTAFGLKVPLPDRPDIYNVTLILYLFWLCAICDIGVSLYDRLQRSEFRAHRELEKAYQKLGEAEAKYRSIFENAVEGIFQSTPNGRYITANPALARIYGYSSPEELIEKCTDIEHQLYVNPNRHAEFRRLIEENDNVSEFESQIYRKDGSIVWISEKAYAVRDENGKILFYEGLIEDITKRKQAEESLRVFFHAVSHDLRNPVLGTLMVLKNLLNREVGEESVRSPIPVTRSTLERMVQSSDRQLNLINSLLEAHISEVQGVVLQRQPIQIHTVIESAIADLELTIAENQVTLTNLVSVDLPSVNADLTQLWRVYSNLIVNAIKHNLPGLTITLDATVRSDMLYCTVADNGVGMSKQQSQRLFDLYFRGNTNRHSLSLGLGLYLSKQIIVAHGGDIGVESAPDAGATFWFTLPL
ncbi:MAG: PAS domain-containing sensor histidine kinase [Scytonema sp. PMC 1069.18]|nr:PAS domain-containing sensor histidine kinase [Scytonema sp. PMC 1069.18]MEC4886359.1 PAS domain-containing sensor histidine kinase [Scytonema sp. PMC 1070.18]